MRHRKALHRFDCSPGHIIPMQVAIARAAVDEAHRHGQWSLLIPRILRGRKWRSTPGVDVLAHTPEDTSGIDEAMLRRMIAQHMTIIPTLKLFSRDDNIAKIRGLDYRFHQLGGRLVYGTDTGFLTDYDQSEEFRQLMQGRVWLSRCAGDVDDGPGGAVSLSAARRKGDARNARRSDDSVRRPGIGEPDAFTKARYTIRGGQGDLALG